jgi:hypothetical protein
VPLCSLFIEIKTLFKSLPKNANSPGLKKETNEVPLCICTKQAKASITLEAAVVVPLVAGFLAMILFWFRVLEVETEVYAALSYASRQTAAVGSLSDNTSAELALAESFFLTKLAEADTAGSYLGTSQKAVMLAGSSLDGEYVDLVADYRIKLPVSFFSVKDIHIRQESKSRKWTGDTKTDDADDVYVYVAENGTVYHLTRDCKYLELSIKTVEVSQIGGLRNRSEHKYYECERCAAKNTGQKTCYITDYGDSYHYSLSCSGLKRTVHIVPKSEVGDKRVCSKCEKNAKR